MSNYQSPYGFGPATDAILDVIADRRGMSIDELSAHIHRNKPTVVTGSTGIYDWLDLSAWDRVIGPAIDILEDVIFPRETQP